MNIDAVEAAAERLRGVAHRTPVLTCETLDRMSGHQIFFKCEHLQRVGAFKFRGAFNAISRLTEAQAARGVVTHSSGNHAQAVALSASLRGVAAHIVMPSNAPAVKRRAVADYGARIILCEPTLVAREAAAAAVIAETGATLIHPYDHPDVIAGQGTAALELLEGVDLDVIITPVGGGGLLSGTALVGEARGVRVLGAEPAGADDAARSKAAGRLIPQTGPNTVADGLLTSLGEHTWPVVRDRVEAILTVDDAAIIAAMRLLWERAKLLVEASAAVPLAVLLSGQLAAPEPLRVGVILSGGNVDLDALPW